jgi:hypothetical protein
MRGTIDGSIPYANAIAFSDANTLFGFDNYSSAFGLSKLNVGPSGISLASYSSRVISGFGVAIAVADGVIYATSGAAVDAAQVQLMGTYQSSGPVVVDSALHSVFFVNGTSVEEFDRDAFVPIFSLTIANAHGHPTSASGCGLGCIAVVFDSGQIFILPQALDEIFFDGFD